MLLSAMFVQALLHTNATACEVSIQWQRHTLVLDTIIS
jgi:hypothetical protein